MLNKGLLAWDNSPIVIVFYKTNVLFCFFDRDI
jgi:hypothetical protein